MFVHLLTWFQYNSTLLMKFGVEVLKRQLASKMDESNIDVKSHIGYAGMLAAFKGRNLSHVGQALHDDQVLEHMYYSYIGAIPTSILIELYDIGCVNIMRTSTAVPDKTAVIMSDNCLQWKQAVIRALSFNETSEGIKSFFNSIFDCFAADGLDGIWYAFSKRQQNNQLYVLQKR